MSGKGLSLDDLENYLKGREFLLIDFSVADAYLVTVINDIAIAEKDRRFHWPAPGPRPAEMPGLGESPF